MTPPPKLVPDRPSDAAIAKAVREVAGLIQTEAFAYPSANSHTPRIIELCQRLELLSREIDAAAPAAPAPDTAGSSPVFDDRVIVADMLRQYAAVLESGELDGAGHAYPAAIIEQAELLETATTPRVTGGRAEEWRAVETMLRNLGQPGMADSAAGFRIIEAEAVKQRLHAALAEEEDNSG